MDDDPGGPSDGSDGGAPLEDVYDDDGPGARADPAVDEGGEGPGGPHEDPEEVLIPDDLQETRPVALRPYPHPSRLRRRGM
eukprot:8759890-Pyramimonas_sp.AAC.1